jgi:RNA polymerase sigma factor (sigma-70 family)
MTRLRGASRGAIFSQLEGLFRHGTLVGSSEGELLERFVADRDEAAFEALLARHGRMVVGVCRQLLNDPNDVDDAFQATFLVLVRKASTLRRTDLLGNWLYGVAYRVASRARSLSARRAARNSPGQDAVENLTATECGRETGVDQATAFEEAPWLHQELSHLPEKYRIPIVLCYFEGLTHDEAASRLGWPLGTVKGRLARARDLLRRRLTVRGVTLSATALASHLALAEATAGVPAALRTATLKAAWALTCRAGLTMTAVSGVSLPVVSLVEGVVQIMRLSQLRTITVPLLIATATIATGVVVGAPRSARDPVDGQTTPQPAAPAAVETRDFFKAEVKALRKVSGSAPQQTLRKSAEAVSSRSPSPGPGTPELRKSAVAVSSPSPSPGPETPEIRDGGFRPAAGDGMGGMPGVMGKRAGRLMIAASAAQLAAQQNDPHTTAILKKLDEPVAMPFANESPLEDVLKYIKQVTAIAGTQGNPGSPGIPIYLDPKGLKEAEVMLSAPVTLDLEGVPLKTTLRLILKQLDLAYCVRDGVLIISSVQGINEELQEALRELEGSSPGGVQ